VRRIRLSFRSTADLAHPDDPAGRGTAEEIEPPLELPYRRGADHVELLRSPSGATAALSCWWCAKRPPKRTCTGLDADVFVLQTAPGVSANGSF
jgi:hypothetical protein